MDLLVGPAVVQRLGVGIHRYEVDPCYSGVHHPIDGRAAGAAYTHYFDAGKCFYCWVNFGHYSSLRFSLYNYTQFAVLNAINTQAEMPEL
jgi:hypothetical protein